MTEPAQPVQLPGYSTRYKIVIVVVLALAIAAFTAAVMKADTDPNDVQLSGGGDYVELLRPGRGDEIQRQETIGIDLASGWTGTLSIKRPGDQTFVPIPAKELQEVRELNQLLYTSRDDLPGPDLQAGTNCVLATVWEIATGSDEAHNVSWCFEVT
jgi:hypothetical protein